MKFKRAFRKALFKAQTWLIKAGAWTKDALALTGRTTKKTTKALIRLTKKAGTGLFRFLGLILDDILLLAGIGALFYGIGLIYEPAAFIFLGLALIGLAYLVAHKRARR